MSHLTNPAFDHEAKHDEMIASLREMAEHLGKEASDGASRAAATLAHAAAEFVEQTKKAATPIAKSASKEIREHPVTTAALVAASVGLISYALTRNRSRSA